MQTPRYTNTKGNNACIAIASQCHFAFKHNDTCMGNASDKEDARIVSDDIYKLGCLFAGLKDTGKFPNVKSTIFSIGT
jgi:hypothetical protein